MPVAACAYHASAPILRTIYRKWCVRDAKEEINRSNRQVCDRGEERAMMIKKIVWVGEDILQVDRGYPIAARGKHSSCRLHPGELKDWWKRKA